MHIEPIANLDSDGKRNVRQFHLPCADGESDGPVSQIRVTIPASGCSLNMNELPVNSFGQYSVAGVVKLAMRLSWFNMMHRLNPFRCAVLITFISIGCNASKPTVDEGPFREAIGQYVKANNMAMKMKEIKEGPVIDGDAARMTASMIHDQLAGPSVTWEFQFAKQANGSWQVTRHTD